MLIFACIATIVGGPFVALLVEKKLHKRRVERERRLQAYRSRLQAVSAALQETGTTSGD